MLSKTRKLNKINLILFPFLGLMFIQVLFLFPQVVDKEYQTQQSDLVDQTEALKLKQSEKATKKSMEQQLKGLHLVENSNNAKGWELQAEEAIGSSDDRWVLKKVRVEFFNENETSFVVSGELGEIDGQSKDILIRGHVVTTSSNGYQFETQDLRYVDKEKKLKSTDQVNMIGPEDKDGPGFLLTGFGFYVDIKTNQMVIENNIEAHKFINDKKFNIKANEAIFSNKNQEALFHKNTVLTFGESKAISPQAFFKYNEKQKSLKYIILKENVKLYEIEKEAQCKELIMNMKEDKLILTGSPQVKIGEDILTGEEIVMSQGAKKIKVNKVKIESQNLLNQ